MPYVHLALIWLNAKSTFSVDSQLKSVQVILKSTINFIQKPAKVHPKMCIGESGTVEKHDVLFAN